jgi:hypothetical protein
VTIARAGGFAVLLALVISADACSTASAPAELPAVLIRLLLVASLYLIMEAAKAAAHRTLGAVAPPEEGAWGQAPAGRLPDAAAKPLKAETD